MRITYLVKRWNHHTASGGYDRLASVGIAKVVRRNRTSRLTSKVLKKMWVRWTSTHKYLLDYDFEDLLAELRLLIVCLIDPPDVVHVLYGDEQLDLLLRWRSLLRCALVVTFHLPADEVAKRFEYFQRSELKGIDAAIIVAKSETARFEHWFGANKVIYVPHGVDTAQFRPDLDRPAHGELRLIFVGDHYRDWDVAHRVIDEVHRRRLNVHFDVVTRLQSFSYFTGCSNVTLHSEIPEPRLIELYQRADALFMPVESATANNAVLESLACGTPVLATDIGGMPDYVNGDCGWLIPKGDAIFAVELIAHLCTHREMVNLRRENARAQALKFDWQRVANRLSLVYAAVNARSPLPPAF